MFFYRIFGSRGFILKFDTKILTKRHKIKFNKLSKNFLEEGGGKQWGRKGKHTVVELYNVQRSDNKS